MSKKQEIADTSIFAGIFEFTVADQDYRAESRGSGVYSVFVKHDDAFIHDAIVMVDGNVSCSKIFAAYEAYSAL